MTSLFNLFFKLSLALCFFSLGLFSAFLGWVLFQAPDVESLNGCIRTTMHQVDLCDQKDTYVHLPMVPQHFIDSLIVNEDASFFYHNGFDLHEIKRSMIQNIERMEYFRGASTLSQQLIKNVFLSPDKDVARKIKEIYLTYTLENSFSKKQILEKYINVVEYGKNIYGLKQAAKFYFHKDPIDLNVLESSFLVYLLPSPTLYSQSFYKKKLSTHAKKRIQQTLRRLLKYRKITESKYMVASSYIDEFPWHGISLNVVDQIPTDYIFTQDSEDSL